MVASAVPTFKAALFTKCQTLFPAILVTYGHPGTARPDDIIAVRNAEAESAFVPLGAHKREESVELELVISCYRGGGAVAQQVVTEIAYDYLNTLDASIRKPAGDPTLGGVVSWCEIRSHSLTESDESLVAQGRVAEIIATVHARIRI